MVSVVHSVAAQSDFDQFFATLSDGLLPDDVTRLRGAVEYAWETYGERLLGSGERIWSHALGMAVIIAGLKLDAESRIAAVLGSLEKKGLLERENDAGDRRRVLVSLTQAGEALCEKRKAHFKSKIALLLSMLGDDAPAA